MERVGMVRGQRKVGIEVNLVEEELFGVEERMDERVIPEVGRG
jgi:hypothetical protein